jgi:exosortase
MSLPEELALVWRQLPHRGLLAILLIAWIAVFHFFGNSTLGYVNTASLFGWWQWTMKGVADQEISYFIPLIVLVLLWCRRDELLEMEKTVWWPAVGILLLAMVTHVLGYMVQQARLSIVGFFLGAYGLVGLLWGRGWLRLALFPFFLFSFCIPLGGGLTEAISFPMRLFASQITAAVSGTVLGIDVIRNGTQLADASGTYQYEVAAACSGLRSLMAIVALGFIYGFISFKTSWRRALAVIAAFPLAVVANVFRLTLIILAAEAFGQKAGNYVHENTLFSLAPYLPAFAGMFALGWLLREDRRPARGEEPLPVAAAEQRS